MLGRIGAVVLVLGAWSAGVVAAPAPLAVASVSAQGGERRYTAEGLVEAVRQTSLAAQVPARVVAVKVRAGDAVKSGQVLVELDPRAAADQVRASDAQAAAAQAQLDAAKKDYERNQRLHAKQYISQAAMDQAEAQYRARAAEARATLAQAGIASTQATFTRITAPYAGVVASVAVEQGDLASPGAALLTLYDPTELRVVATVPESQALQLAPAGAATIELPAANGASRQIAGTGTQLLPTTDPGTHTRAVRITLPAGAGLAPGTFVRASLPQTGEGGSRLVMPASALVRRPGFDAVYVVDAAGRAQLRQVRIGRRIGTEVEVLAGVSAGDRVALDPALAVRQ